MTPSKYQQAVFNFIKSFALGLSDNINLIIKAVAGSGKTTTIIESLKLIPDDVSVLFLAFNKSIVEHLKTKVNQYQSNINIQTLHALGAAAIRFHFKNSILDNSKYKTILENLITNRNLLEDMEFEEALVYKQNVLKLVDLKRLYLDVDVAEIATTYGINTILNECSVVLDILEIGKYDRTKYDFTDMIWLPVVHDLKMKQHKIVFIDESQDMSFCQRKLMQKAVAKDGIFVAIGDPQQSIYFFSGSSSNSMDELKKLGRYKELPLSVCYRCPTKVIELAKNIVPEIEASEFAQEGEVDEFALIEDLVDEDLVMCRNTAPLISLAIKLLSEGKAAYVMGREIGLDLIQIIKKTKENNLDRMLKKLDDNLSNFLIKIAEQEKIGQKEAMESAQYSMLADKNKAIKILSKDLKNIDELVSKIQSIFSDDKKGIILSTIHKAKGLEADNAYLICPELLPAHYAKKNKEMMKQEKNLEYIAITRAKKKYGIISDFKFK